MRAVKEFVRIIGRCLIKKVSERSAVKEFVCRIVKCLRVESCKGVC